MISTFPQEILVHILSFLEVKDLVPAARVCAQWQSILLENVWKKRCLDNLDHVSLYQNSWKNRFRIIHHWKNGLAEVHSAPPSYKAPSFHDFTILDDNTKFEIYPSPSNPFIYTLHNQSTEKVSFINLKTLGMTEVICTHLEGHMWIVMDSKGHIYGFDIRTEQCVQKINFQNKEPLARFDAVIKCEEEEIIVACKREIKIWNKETGNLKQNLHLSSIDFLRIGKIYKLNATTNFIIFKTRDNQDESRIFTIQKSHLTITQITNSSFSAASPSYLAMLSTQGKIKVFEDKEQALVLTHTFKAFNFISRPLFGCIRLYQNWLMISLNRKLHIWNVKTGKKISTVLHPEQRFEFRTNTIQLFSRSVITNSDDLKQYSYVTHDFEDTSSNGAVSKKRLKKSRLKSCKIQ